MSGGPKPTSVKEKGSFGAPFLLKVTMKVTLALWLVRE